MIGKIPPTSSSFKDLFEYLLTKKYQGQKINRKGAEILFTTGSTHNWQELAQEFQFFASFRPSTKKPVKHIILSFAPEDGEIDDSLAMIITDQVIKRLGYTQNSHAIIKHKEEKHQHNHFHIVLNMIAHDGTRTKDGWDKRRLEKILRQLEQEWCLTQVEPSQVASKQISTRNLKKVQAALEENNLELIPNKIKLQGAIDQATKDKPNFKTFVARLQHLGIDVQPKITDKGRKRISYKIAGLQPFAGSKLHNASFPKLISKHRIIFDSDQAQNTINAVNQGKTISVDKTQLFEWEDINFSQYLESFIEQSEIEFNQTPSHIQQIKKKQDIEL